MSNKSKTYLLPLIKDMFDKVSDINYVTDTFTFYKHYKDCLVLQIDIIEDSEEFEIFINDFINHKDILHCIVKDTYIITVVKYPNLKVRDYFIEGKYSMFDKKSMKIILNETLRRYGRSFYNRVRGVLYKQEFLKKELELKLNVILPANAELSSIINENEERYNDDRRISEISE